MGASCEIAQLRFLLRCVSRSMPEPDETKWLGAQLASWAARLRYEDLPPIVVAKAKALLLDTLSVGWAGSGAEGIAEVRGLVQAQGGAAESRVWSFGERMPAPQAAFLNGSAGLTLRSSEQLDLVAVSMDRQMMLDTLTQLDRALAECFAKLNVDSMVVDGSVTQDLARLLLEPLGDGSGVPDWLQSDAQQRDYLEQVCLTAAHALCGGSGPRDCGRRVRDNRQQLVERATKYLDRSWFEPIRITEICRDLHADRRTLQNAFQDVLGISPNAFFKNVRLNRAHQDLKRRCDHEEPICDVAMRWGFWHLSQFARDYQRAFGELPSETRKRARSFALGH